MRAILLVIAATAIAMPGVVRADQPDSVSLAEAVRQFNERCQKSGIGREEQPLKAEEVVAAIRWAMLDREKLAVSDETFRTLGRIAKGGWLPKAFDLEVLTRYEPNEEVTFNVWSVRLRVPGGSLAGGTTCVTIQEKMVSSRLIGEEERKVIREWREKEGAQGGIGSLERPNWMRDYQAAREAAAAVDQKNRGGK